MADFSAPHLPGRQAIDDRDFAQTQCLDRLDARGEPPFDDALRLRGAAGEILLVQAESREVAGKFRLRVRDDRIRNPVLGARGGNCQQGGGRQLRLAKMNRDPVHARHFHAAAGLGPGGQKVTAGRLGQFEQPPRQVIARQFSVAQPGNARRHVDGQAASQVRGFPATQRADVFAAIGAVAGELE